MIKKLDKLILKSFLGPFIVTFFIAFFVLMMQTLWKYRFLRTFRPRRCCRTTDATPSMSPWDTLADRGCSRAATLASISSTGASS